MKILKNEIIYFEGTVNEEKRKKYEKAFKFVEISSKYFLIGYIVAMPLLTMPYLFMSYFNYYIAELEDDSFRLPFVIWYGNHG